jgi:hypothetical protein
VIATIETWVAGVVGITEGSATGGYKVPIIVPRLVIKASPGPAKLLDIGQSQAREVLA